MSDAKHTPDPLTAEWLAEALNDYREGTSDEPRLNTTGGIAIEIRRRAAAPELLEELQRMYEAARCMADPEHCLHEQREELPWRELADKARAAIAKATSK